MASRGPFRGEAAGYTPLLVNAPGFETVECWMSALADIPVSEESMAAALDPAERARAARFRFARDRDRFIRRRWLRRRIIADRFGVPLSEVCVEAEPLGRPRLIGPMGFIGLSTSHADGVALVALRVAGEVGVDIARSDGVDTSAATVFMSDHELREWSVLQGTESAAAYLRVWTRKEACLKVSGTGLSRDPRSLEAWGESVSSAAHPDDRPDGVWRTTAVDVGPGWVASVAVDDER